MNYAIKISLMVTAISLLSSCKSEEEKLTETAVNEIKQSLLDPKSMEVIEIELDTLHASWRIADEADQYITKQKQWATVFEEFNDDVEWEHRMGRPAGKTLMNALQESYDSVKHYTELWDKEMKRAEKIMNTPQDSVIGYSVKVRYYATNRGSNRTMGENRYYKLNNGHTHLEDISPLAKL